MIRSRYSEPVRCQVDTGSVSKVQQHSKDECDVNYILKRWAKTGVCEHVASKSPRYVDCSSASYKEALDMVMDSQDLFSGLPAKVRAKFRNDPALFLAFCEDPDNSKDLLDLGLTKESDEIVKGQKEESDSGKSDVV